MVLARPGYVMLLVFVQAELCGLIVMVFCRVDAITFMRASLMGIQGKLQLKF